MENDRMNLLGKIEEEEKEEVPLPGFRFHPTDEELVGFYLRRKVEKKKFSIDIIKQVDIYKFDPWHLAKQSTAVGVQENECYFFCLREMKYRNSVRPNRVTRSGYWKATGIDKKIIFPHGSNNCIGLKKSLVYYCGKGGKGTKTYWMMHEFRLPPVENQTSKDLKSISPNLAHEAENWTICRIFRRNPSSPKKSTEQSTSCVVESSDSGHQILEEFFPTSVAPPDEDVLVKDLNCQQEQVVDQFADKEKLSSSSFFDGILSGNPDSSCVFPDVLDDFGDTNWDELGRFFKSSADCNVFGFSHVHM